MSLATEFPRLFWDVEPRGVDEQRHAQYVIERVLEHGTLESVRAVFASYSREAIVDVICRSRRISRRTASFWQVYLNIEDPIACLKPRSPHRPSSLWE